MKKRQPKLKAQTENDFACIASQFAMQFGWFAMQFQKVNCKFCVLILDKYLIQKYWFFFLNHSFSRKKSNFFCHVEYFYSRAKLTNEKCCYALYWNSTANRNTCLWDCGFLSLRHWTNAWICLFWATVTWNFITKLMFSTWKVRTVVYYICKV